MKQIQLTQGKVAIVDDEDFEELNKFKWYCKRGYAVRTTRIDDKYQTQFIHRIVNDTPDGLFTDHINSNKLDNRRQNLRSCTIAENSKNRKLSKNNSSSFKGVSFNKEKGKWIARIRVNNKNKFLGYYDSAEEAASIYDKASIELHKEFCKTNADLIKKLAL